MGSNTKTVDIGTLETKTVFVKVKSISGKIKQYVVNIVREPDPLELKDVYVDNRLATKVSDTEYTIDVLDTKTNIDIQAILFNTVDEYVAIEDNTPSIGVNTYNAYQLSNGYKVDAISRQYNPRDKYIECLKDNKRYL